MQDNLSGQFTILKSQLQELAISLKKELYPPIGRLRRKTLMKRSTMLKLAEEISF